MEYYTRSGSKLLGLLKDYLEFHITKWPRKILEVNSCHVKNEFELTTDLEAVHSQVA